MRRVLVTTALLTLAGICLPAQATRRLTTIDALRQFPGFYHLQPVLVRGEVVETGARVMLRTDEHEIRLLLDRDTRTTAGSVEVRGTLLDVGRLEPGDGRLASFERPPDSAWPKPGEELLLQATSLAVHTPGAPLSPRVLILEPWRFEGQPVTVTGQFRGRNLFGDLPGAPRKSQYDFVVKNGDASVWVVGLRPRGKGFDLNVDARIDTGQWLEVTGVAKRSGGLVTIEASRLTPLKEAPATTEREEPSAPPPPPPPVEVVFSAPTPGEIEVPSTTTVRIQFSRNIKLDTVKDHVKVTYLDPAAPDQAPAPIELKTQYDAATRALEVTFPKPLEKLRAVKVDVLPGVLAFDGAEVRPWSLTFTVGG